MDIIPAIIGKNFKEVDEKVIAVENFVHWVHLDVMDGLFTLNPSWPYLDTEGASKDLGKIDFIETSNVRAEIHLMTEHPERNIVRWIDAGAGRILVHQESTDEDNMMGILEQLADAEVEAGIVLKYDTPINVVDQYIDQLDVVQLMSIAEIGAYGQPLEEGIYDKISSLRARYPGVTISVDGGVNLDNAGRLMQAGADYLVAGSAIFKSGNIEEVINSFKNI